MIESIYQIGRAILKKGGSRRTVLESLAENPPTDKDGKSYIAVMKLDTSSWKLEVDLRELDREDNNTAARYLGLGNASAKTPQDRLTTDTLGYLISQSVPVLLGKDKLKEDTRLYKVLRHLKKELYLDLGEAKELGVHAGGFNAHRYLWDLRKLGIEGPSREELRELIRSGTEPKKVPQQVAKALRNHFKHEIPDQGVLFTLELDGELLVDDEAYQEYLERSLIDNAFNKAQYGRCHLSGTEEPVTTDMTRFKFKYYITDKLSFASGATKKGFGSNFALSKDAYRALLVGERFVRRELGFYFASSRGYLIPDLYTAEVPKKLPDALLRTLRSISLRTRFALGQVRVDDLDEDLEDFRRKYLASGYMINLLFYKGSPGRSDFVIMQLIQDIPDYRLEELRQQGRETGRLWEELYGGEERDLTLQQIYYLIPVHAVRKSGGTVEYLNKEILGFYHTLISGGLIEHKGLVGGFMELVRAYRFSNTNSYQISAPVKGEKEDEKDAKDRTIIRYLAQSNLLLSFLRDLDQLKEEEVTQEYLQSLSLEEEEKKYLRRLGYGPQQAALYLLGVLIAEIANAQRRLGPEGRGGEKTILNKINYQGMTLPRVQRLATELFDKLRQYHYTDRNDERRPLLQGCNEATFAQAQELLTEHQRGWPLTPAENVYYLLSGYSHYTFKVMTTKKKQPTVA